ncbi:ATP-binding protein [Ignatzschineria rhizosphaerae]|uniref:ATP-binding protein n=1 Tax=Ignatzschineria rhizosphaerae TaxID=2923279 RepID=A0ABY3X6Q1_9GAMM|nr:ATP-binding protein [Ignatzschineria rhizosphaerae]UNM96712.1 ATP-binding protein [Ignatzschineria rhizosphaerae]
MRNIDLLHDLPWLELGPTEEVMGRIEQHISTNRGDFYSVYGPSGCGKTRFMLELSKRLDSFDHIVARNITAGQDSVLAQIAGMLETTEDEAEIIARLEEVPPTGLKMVLLVDDADYLSNEELSFLYRVKEKINKINRKANVVIVLFMDLNNQDIFSKELLLHSNSFTIGPINLTQVREFIAHIYRYFGKEPHYTLTELKQLHAFSYGYPGRIARLIAPDLEPRFVFKKKHAFWGIFFVLLMALGGYFALYYKTLLPMLGIELPITESSVITHDSAITPSYFPAIEEMIEEAEQTKEDISQGIIIIQDSDNIEMQDQLLDDVIDEILDETQQNESL